MAQALLDGHLALVTGAAKRLGRVITLRLAQAGADVVVHHRSSAKAAASLVQEIGGLGRQAHVLKADLADPKKAANVIPKAAKAAGRPLSLLVNNASIFPEATLADATYKDLDQNMRVNAWAPTELMRGFADQAPPEAGSAIVNLLDSRVADYDFRHVPYILSKKTLDELTRIAAIQYAPEVRVNAVAPGPILPAAGTSEETFRRLGSAVPMGRTGTPMQVAEAVLYLMQAEYTTGQVLHVDGGRHLGRMIHG